MFVTGSAGAKYSVGCIFVPAGRTDDRGRSSGRLLFLPMGLRTFNYLQHVIRGVLTSSSIFLGRSISDPLPGGNLGHPVLILSPLERGLEMWCLLMVFQRLRIAPDLETHEVVLIVC